MKFPRLEIIVLKVILLMKINHKLVIPLIAYFYNCTLPVLKLTALSVYPIGAKSLLNASFAFSCARWRSQFWIASSVIFSRALFLTSVSSCTSPAERIPRFLVKGLVSGVNEEWRICACGSVRVTSLFSFTDTAPVERLLRLNHAVISA